jgi:CSLREA domain-containing protein
MHPLSIQPVRKICLTGLIAATMLSLWLALMPLPVYAQGPVVNTALDENDSNCNDGDCSLRDAIQTAVAGETVTFDNSIPSI